MIDLRFKKLTTLKGQHIRNICSGDFDCSDNKLISLKGSPRIVKGDFDCSMNNLTTLKGMPIIIDGVFDCSFNNLISLKYLSKSTKQLICSYNNLTELPILPVSLEYIECRGNKLPYNNYDGWNIEEIKKDVIKRHRQKKLKRILND
jgi:Leucine-rich repeat (LRR) protein